MNKSITQDAQNDNQISKTIRRFFTRFHISSALESANAYKSKGISVAEIFQYLFILIFSNRSMYMNLLSGRNTPAFRKDTVYRFMKMTQINWIRFTTVLSSRIIKDAIVPLDSEDRANVLIPSVLCMVGSDVGGQYQRCGQCGWNSGTNWFVCGRRRGYDNDSFRF